MKRLTFVAALLFCFATSGAVVNFNNLDPAYFTTNGYVVQPTGSRVPVLWVATNGSDLASGLASNVPMATVQAALDKLTNFNGGTVVLRGGNYGAQTGWLAKVSGRVIIKAAANEVPVFNLGTNVTSWGSLSNNIYTNAPAPAAAVALAAQEFNYTVLGDRFAYEIGTPLGATSTNAPVTNSIYGGIGGTFTNRMPDSPIVFYTNVALLNSAPGAGWTVSNGIVYVKFTGTNAPGGRGITWPAASGNFLSGGNQGLDLEVSGLQVKFPHVGIEVGGCGNVTLKNLFIEGAYTAGINKGNVCDYLALYDVEACGSSGWGFNEDSLDQGFGMSGSRISTIDEFGCYWHDNAREGASTRGATVRHVYGSTTSFNQYGYIVDGSASVYLHGTISLHDNNGVQLGGPNGTNVSRALVTENCQFINTTNGGVLIEGAHNYWRSFRDHFNVYPSAAPAGFVPAAGGDSASCRADIIEPTVGTNAYTAGTMQFFTGLTTFTNITWAPKRFVASPFEPPHVEVNSNGLNFVSYPGDTARRSIYWYGNATLAADTLYQVFLGEVGTLTAPNSSHALMGGYNNQCVDAEQYPIVFSLNSFVRGNSTAAGLFGGWANTISGGSRATIVGGQTDSISNANWSVIINGLNLNSAHDGVVMLGDAWYGSVSTLNSTSSNQLIARFVGGASFVPDNTKTLVNSNFNVGYPVTFLKTNYVAADFAPVSGAVKLVWSNYVQYAVTPFKTQMVVNAGP